jgi:3-phenylpropionate/trans-cinnamate dioxygenase ferredoxin reductase subunit
VYRGDRKGREVIVFWLHNGRVAAGMNINVWGVTEQLAELVSSKRVVDPDQLADVDSDLAELVSAD